MPKHKYKTSLFTKTSVNAVILTGILSFLMYPFVVKGYHFPDMGFFVWFFVVPLVIGIHRHKFWHKFILCFLSGIIANYGIYYWLITAMQQFGGLSFPMSFLCLTGQCIILSLLFALFLSMASWINHVTKIPLLILLPLFMTTRDVIAHYFPFNGFPWAIPPYALGEWLPFFQWIDHTGIYGLSFFIYLINGLLAGGFLVFIHRRQVDKMVVRFVVVFVLILLSLYLSFLSNQIYEQNKITKRSLNIALIQGNIAQDKKWNWVFAQDILNTYFKLTNKAVKDGAKLVIWPETAYPFSGLSYPALFEETFLNKERLSTPMLIGAFVDETIQGEKHVFNSIIHIDTYARIRNLYRKTHLVPFGEYLPFKEYIDSFFPSITRVVGELSAGKEYTLFNILDLKVGSLICFEDIFPEPARIFSAKGADILVNYSNDAWYGDSSAQHQHLVFSQFRALENRRFLLRATNTGLTAIITPRGEIFDKLPPFTGSYLLHNIKIDHAQSFYTKHGSDWVFIICGLGLLVFIYAIIKRLTGPVRLEF
ncbi:MAG: apolipoprotein N-acyltransferase [bacterium]